MKKTILVSCLLFTSFTQAAGSRRLSILAQRTTAQIQSNLNNLTSEQDEALLKRYEEIMSILEGDIPSDDSGSDEKYFFCSGGYIYDTQGAQLDYISGGQEACLAAIKGKFYCDGGYLNNVEGEDLDYISGGQESCLKAVKGSFYCDGGYVNNSEGKDLDYISGGQESCLAAIKGKFYCDSGYLNNEEGEDLRYISGGQDACIASL